MASKGQGQGSQAASRIEGFTGQAGEMASQVADRASEYAGEAFDAARDAGYRVVRQTSRQVKSHPLESVGIAFGAGIIVGMLMDRMLFGGD